MSESMSDAEQVAAFVRAQKAWRADYPSSARSAGERVGTVYETDDQGKAVEVCVTLGNLDGVLADRARLLAEVERLTVTLRQLHDLTPFDDQDEFFVADEVRGIVEETLAGREPEVSGLAGEDTRALPTTWTDPARGTVYDLTKPHRGGDEDDFWHHVGWIDLDKPVPLMGWSGSPDGRTVKRSWSDISTLDQLITGYGALTPVEPTTLNPQEGQPA